MIETLLAAIGKRPPLGKWFMSEVERAQSPDPSNYGTFRYFTGSTFQLMQSFKYRYTILKTT